MNQEQKILKDTCDAVNRVYKFNLDCSKYNKEATTIVVNIDHDPNEFSWELSNTESDAIIASMGPFQKAYTHYEHTECLQEGKYIFTAYDTWQDGLTKCYNSTICGYHLSVNDEILFESDNGNLEIKDHKFKISNKSKNKKKNKSKKKNKTKKMKKTKKKKKPSSKKKKVNKNKTKKKKPSKRTERPRGNRRPTLFLKT